MTETPLPMPVEAIIEQFNKTHDHDEKEDYLTNDIAVDRINRNVDNWKINERMNEFENTPMSKRRESKNNWIIPRGRKESAEEIIEEDRQYLQEISF